MRRIGYAEPEEAKEALVGPPLLPERSLTSERGSRDDEVAFDEAEPAPAEPCAEPRALPLPPLLPPSE